MEDPPRERRTRWTHSSIPLGIFCVTWILKTRSCRSIRSGRKLECRWISTLAERNTVRFFFCYRLRLYSFKDPPWRYLNLFVHSFAFFPHPAVLHLFFARFVCHFLHILGLVPHPEPFRRLLVQGMVMGRSYRVKGSGKYLKPEEIDFSGM